MESRYRTDEEKQSDIMIGEAVIHLLDEGTPVTTDLLLLRLHAALLTASEPWKISAARDAISTIQMALAHNLSAEPFCFYDAVTEVKH